MYLTDDGNYAIADSNDDQVTGKESQSKSQQNSKEMDEDDSFILPDLDAKSPSKQVLRIDKFDTSKIRHNTLVCLCDLFRLLVLWQ